MAKQPELKHTRSMLFVCMGNICRSPTAEAVFRHRFEAAGLRIELDSAGTLAYHAGETPDARSAAAGRQRGYDFSGIRARQVRDEDFEHYDLILAADRSNMSDLRQRCPSHLTHKLAMIIDGAEVPDPYYGGSDGFERVLDLLEGAADNWLLRLR
ncbi:low molecular weight protein-tyrosine-phosphatase [Ferrimonas kyonanensis]|uniref:low molecular weight protein-tyrosine-phosphatase n=1 Tax=Ferrimonas kyonanensis TaxID=364763 RepID=UPI000424FDF3|nr:low molecular weight protein-tyrosine-phosphatase [Ferrimonas kyonanensis]